MNEARNVRWIHLAGFGSLAGWAVLAVASHRMERPLPVFLAVMAWEWALLLAAWRALAGMDAARARRVVLAWAAAFFVCAFFAAPVMEDDQFRFLWDGWRFAETGNPYAAAPSEYFSDASVPEKFQGILDQINYPHVPTIYGPVCQAGFLVSHWIAPGELWPWKLLVIAAALGLVWMVASPDFCRSRREEAHSSRAEEDQSLVTSTATEGARAALLMGWCPLLVFEAGFNVHPDVLGVLALVAALWARWRGFDAAMGTLCGVAVAAKVFALPLVPFILWRARAAWLAGVAALAVIYGPFWLRGSGAEFAGLLQFAREWEFNSSLFGVARWGLGAAAAKGICGALFVAAWVWLFLRWRNASSPRPCQVAGAPNSCSARGTSEGRVARELGAPIQKQGVTMPPGAAVFGALLLCSATVNPWYLLWLVPFVAWRPTAAGMAALALVSLSYVTGLNIGSPTLDSFAHPWWLRPLEYGGLASAALVEWRRNGSQTRSAG